MIKAAIIEFLRGLGIGGWYLDVAAALVLALANFAVLGTLVALLVYMERKVSADIQKRYGPLHVGPHGLFQLIADMVKLLTKEDIFPRLADPWVFRIAPALMFVAAFIGYMVIPVSPGIVVQDMNVGLIYFLAIPALGVAGLIMAGYGSHNRFAIMGSLRSAAQMVSYEVPRSLSVIGVVMLAETVRLSAIVEAQSLWFIILQPLGFFIFFVSSIAEVNRVPFDIPEAESELVSGYHTEYSGMRFAFFLFAEYLSMFAVAALTVLLFLGGWNGPGPEYLAPVWFLTKLYLVVYVLMWIRWTFPRFRIDQVMNLCWKVLMPLAFINIFLTGIIMTYA